MSQHDGTGRFFLPGPTEVYPDVAAAQMGPMIGHRGAGMEELIARLEDGLRMVFRTARPVYVVPSSATGLMEGALRNGARKRVLSLVNGAFSERFYRIALSCGLDAERLDVPLGEVHTPEMLERALQDGRFDAVTVVHSETSTGALNPIAQLARVAHAAGDVALLVDSVSGMAGAPVETDAWELDVVLTGSQKAFALPPGLAFAAVRPHILDRARQSEARGTYFDFVEYEKFTLKHQTPNTPAISLLYALDVQLGRIQREGIEQRWARHAAMAERTWRWVDEMRARGVDLAVLAPPGARSPTVSCVRVPPPHTGPAITAEMAKRGWTIGSGYGPLKDSTIRIGHMGDHTVRELDALLQELTAVLLP
ncbi:MAG TPA: alanine--glyoxylate aminotransferase family protein [Gemmatimonadaceae bacterium]|nr:alanine--glyoxylate aminotransferase family protein [Gemmatimonadaceae bacterium]